MYPVTITLVYGMTYSIYMYIPCLIAIAITKYGNSNYSSPKLSSSSIFCLPLVADPLQPPRLSAIHGSGAAPSPRHHNLWPWPQGPWPGPPPGNSGFMFVISIFRVPIFFGKSAQNFVFDVVQY